MARALELVRDLGGRVPPDAGKTRTDDDATREGAAGAWREAFLRAPYLRDALIGMGFISDTFETAITWDRFEAFHAAVTERVGAALARICGNGTLTCRFTHVYPDGPAPYYTVLARARDDASAGSAAQAAGCRATARISQLEQWDEIKAAASDAVIEAGGTITHHHAVGRDHRPWYDRQRPDAFAAALRAAKRALDPAAILNPGVLIDP
jgi:alkyldihydroxyacetonephosphate synthase